MAKLARVTNLTFGATAPTDTIEQFGSAVASTPNYTTDPALIQALSAWGDGWTSAIVSGNKAPYVQDMNAVLYVLSYQLSYLFQEGIPEWDSGTTYYINSVVQDNVGGGQWFKSLQNANLNNTPPVSSSNAFWSWINPPTPPAVVVGNALKSNLKQVPDATPNVKVDISADLLSIQGVTVTGVSLVANISASGANGLDTGTVLASHWYALFVITNSAGSSVASLLSLSSSAPTMPAGYTLFRRIGWVRTNASSNILPTYRSGDNVFYSNPNPNTITPSTNTDFSAYVPPTSIEAIVVLQSAGFGASVGSTFVRQVGSGNPYQVVLTGYDEVSATMNLLLNSSQHLDIVDGATSYVIGYVDPV